MQGRYELIYFFLIVGHCLKQRKDHLGVLSQADDAVLRKRNRLLLFNSPISGKGSHHEIFNS
jgi:hypothetical protein